MFFVGLHQPSDAGHFERAFVSVHRIRGRKKPIAAREWIMDSGAFTTIAKHGGFSESPEKYAEEIRRWANSGNLIAAVTQDYMCETWMLKRTGLTVADHQRLTIERYDALIAADTGVYIMPVLQGYEPHEYVAHLAAYGDRIKRGMWVGVGSICKRNGDPAAIEAVLLAIRDARPDIRLHGFGIKRTALSSGLVHQLLHSADSMAWSYSARRQNRGANDWRNAQEMVESIDRMPVQWSLLA